MTETDTLGALTINDATTNIPLTDIAPNPWNPHRMTSAEMQALIDSIREDGQWRPILVVEMDAADETTPEIGERYRIVDGEHCYHALCALSLQGYGDTARVMVLGKNSEIPVWKQQLIGQTMNHGLRGSIEDAEKTAEVVHTILQYKSPEVLAKRLGIGVEGVRALSAAPTALSRPQGKLEGLAKAVPSSPYAERRAFITALSFDDPTKQKRFDDLVDQLGTRYLDPEDYKGRRGQYRVDTLMEILESLSER
jgi:hypothetical protein